MSQHSARAASNETPRVARGVPEGGRFTTGAKDESSVSLGDEPLTPYEVRDQWDREADLRRLEDGGSMELTDGATVSVVATSTTGPIVESGVYLVERLDGTMSEHRFANLAERGEVARDIAADAARRHRDELAAGSRQADHDDYEHPLFGKVIHRYTRSQALADGVLVDHSEMAREAGIAWPVALTSAAQADAVTWTHGGWQDEEGRAWDVLNMCRFTLAKQGDRPVRAGEPIPFQVLRVPHDDPDRHEPVLTTLHAVIGPGDDGKPCITIMMPGED